MSALQINTISHVLKSISRNDEAALTDAEAHIDGVMNAVGIKTTPEARAERHRQYLCERYAQNCWKCNREFADGDIIYRGRIYVGRGFMGTGRYSIVPLCKACAPKRQYQPAAPCAHCGRHVALQYDRLFRRHCVCGYECRASLMIALQKEKRRRERYFKAVTCTQCGETFEPERADSRYCSSPCRQRSYRARKAVAA